MNFERTEDGSRVVSRRNVTLLGAGAALAALAGCTGDGSDNRDGESPVTEGDGGDDAAPSEDGVYEVCMEPADCVQFEEPPNRFGVYHQSWVDIAISLGQADRLVAAAFPGRFPVAYIDQLPGVEFDRDDMFALQEDGDADIEVFYELDLDLHLIDPYSAENYFAIDWSGVEELEQNVAPFLGSWIRRPQYTEDHPHYDLWEVYDIAAEVFQVQERGEAFRELHGEMLEEILAELPPIEERPTVGYLNFDDFDAASGVDVFNPSQPGTQTQTLRDFDVPEHDAFAGIYPEDDFRFTGDFELMVEHDPEVIIYHNGLDGIIRRDGRDWETDVIEPLENDPVANEVTAIQTGRVYPWHEMEQGPIMNTFQTEAIAKSLYPDIFGEPTGMEAPPEDEQLFDRQRVADIITGDI